MADAKKTDAPAEGEAPKPKKKLLLFIIIGVLVVVLGGGAAVFMMKKKAAADEEGADEEEPPAKAVKAKKKKKDAHAAPPTFVKLDPFVVKLQAEGGAESYAQAVPELKLAEPPIADQIKQFAPEIRHKVLLILASKKASELSTPEGMQALANQIRESINVTLEGSKPDPAKEKLDVNEDGPVVSVFFSSLIVQ